MKAKLWAACPTPIKYIALGMVIGQFLGTVNTVLAAVALFLRLR